MSEMTVSAGVPEVAIGSGSMTGAAPTVTLSNDWNKDLAAMAAEVQPQTPAQPELATSQAAVTPAPVAPVVPTAQPNEQAKTAQTAPVVPVAGTAATPAVEVPEKFRGADGKLDQEKLLKSYGDAERALKQAQNKLATTPTAPAVPQVPAVAAPVAQVGNLTPLELQVAKDIWQQGQAGFTEAQAIALARTQVKGWEAAAAMASERALGGVSQIQESINEQRRAAELTSLAKNYPDVLTPKGFEELVKVREENPWINQSPEPWKAAAQLLVGQKGLIGQAGTVVIPTPTGAQNQPIPVTPSAPVSQPVQLNTPAQIEAYVKTLTPTQEAEFWKLQGLKWEAPRANPKY